MTAIDMVCDKQSSLEDVQLIMLHFQHLARKGGEFKTNFQELVYHLSTRLDTTVSRRVYSRYSGELLHETACVPSMEAMRTERIASDIEEVSDLIVHSPCGDWTL